MRPWKGEEREWERERDTYVEGKGKSINKTNKITNRAESQLINWNGAFYEEPRVSPTRLPFVIRLRLRWLHDTSTSDSPWLPAWLPACLPGCLVLSAARPVGRLSGHRLPGIIIIYIKLRGVSAAQRRDSSESVVCAQCPATTPTPTVTAAPAPALASVPTWELRVQLQRRRCLLHNAMRSYFFFSCDMNILFSLYHSLPLSLSLLVFIIFPGPHVVRQLAKFSVFYSHLRLVNKSHALCNPIENWR